MQCPVCEGLLRHQKHQHVEFYVCSACRGIWVSGEQFIGLAALVAAEGHVESNVKLMFHPRKVLRPLPENEALARQCPQCHTAMGEFNYAYDSNIFLDRCPDCQGIWLDPNEIIDIAKHIQYNPDVDVVARELIRRDGIDEDHAAWPYIVVGVIMALLRVLLLRR